jgi:hypothetical protein
MSIRPASISASRRLRAGRFVGPFHSVGRPATYIAGFAGFMAKLWIAERVAAAVSIRNLAMARIAWSCATIRTRIGALLVGAGAPLSQLVRIVAGAAGSAATAAAAAGSAAASGLIVQPV